MHLASVSIVVRDYDEAIAWYTTKLGFTLVDDVAMEGKRWVVVAPPGGTCSIVLAQPSTPDQEAFIGNQAGGRVWLFLQSDDFWKDYGAMKAAGVHFCEEPREEVYATVVVFEDLYGNRWDFLQRKSTQ
ncbi:Aste57867_11166 [Aphanomyces stellatus]|uniref:Aste57867_11166 protein n=1 Tax=Aphanomyces stellatus TaxID=120398 RepID=A0A485KS62_9STRA|nr:hypothetical protein As57867_011124 [Aphanomyces stellatus]VFT88033.1 Aste57867_11166 [Aphanomyces stellatus]